MVKLRAKGYSINNFDDNGETKMISDFENNLSLCMVPLDVFDLPLAKMNNEGVKSVKM